GRAVVDGPGVDLQAQRLGAAEERRGGHRGGHLDTADPGARQPVGQRPPLTRRDPPAPPPPGPARPARAAPPPRHATPPRGRGRDPPSRTIAVPNGDAAMHTGRPRARRVARSRLAENDARQTRSQAFVRRSTSGSGAIAGASFTSRLNRTSGHAASRSSSTG